MNRLIFRSSSRMSFQSATAVRSRLPTYNKIPVDLATEAKLLNFNQLATFDLRNAFSAVEAAKNKKVQIKFGRTNMFVKKCLFCSLTSVEYTNQFSHKVLLSFYSFQVIEQLNSDSWIVRRGPPRLVQEIRRLPFRSYILCRRARHNCWLCGFLRVSCCFRKQVSRKRNQTRLCQSASLVSNSSCAELNPTWIVSILHSATCRNEYEYHRQRSAKAIPRFF